MATKTVSIVTGGTNQAPTTATELNFIATDFISSGIVGAVSLNTGSGGTGGFALNAQSTPDMTVRVTAGKVYDDATPTGGSSQKVRVLMDTFEDVTIATNSTGGTRYDWIYVKFDADKLVTPGANKDDIATLVVSRSTSSASDNGTPPTYGYNLGYVTVANGAASITNSNITDSRTQTGVNAIDTSSAGNGIVSNSNLAANSGWTSFTPSWSNLTPGSGTNTGFYKQIGKTVFVRTRFVFGAGSAVGTGPVMTLPVSTASGYGQDTTILGECGILDTGTAYHFASVRWNGVSAVNPIALNSAGTFVGSSTITSTSPMTWATGDELVMTLCYEAA